MTRLVQVLVVLLLLVSVPVHTQDGVAIAEDPGLFSERFRAEFTDMNTTFAEFGFELEVIQGERPTLSSLHASHGESGDVDDVELTLWLDDAERRVTLRFYYYGDIGFGVLPADPEQRIMVVKRRPD